jgi:putative two-component system response regulator
VLNRDFALNADTGKATILVADDNEANREILSDLLTGEGHSIICAEDGDQALRIIRDGSVDMALLDVMMAGKSGFAVCHAIKSEPETRFIPVVLVTGLSSVDERIQGINSGADDFLSKPVNRHELLARVRSLLRLKAYTDELENAETVLFSLALSIEAKDPYTRGHCDRLATHSLAMAQRRAGIVHDIGKIGVPEHIIVKTGPLTGEERSIMEQHPVTGERICAPLKSFRLVLPIICHHHEKVGRNGIPGWAQRRPDASYGLRPAGCRYLRCADDGSSLPASDAAGRRHRGNAKRSEARVVGWVFGG